MKVVNKKVRVPDGYEMFDARTLGGIYKHGALYVRMTLDFSSTVKEVRYVYMTYMFYCRINWFHIVPLPSYKLRYLLTEVC